MTLYENQIRLLKIELTSEEVEALGIVSGLLFNLYSRLDCNSRITNTETGEVIEENECPRIAGILSGLRNSNSTLWEIKK